MAEVNININIKYIITNGQMELTNQTSIISFVLFLRVFFLCLIGSLVNKLATLAGVQNISDRLVLYICIRYIKKKKIDKSQNVHIFYSIMHFSIKISGKISC